MRRVYYAYGLRLVQHPVTLQIGLFVLALLVFAKMVHVAKVMQSLLGTSVGNLPQFVFNTLMHGEVLTLIAIGTMTFTILSLGWQVVPRVMLGSTKSYA